VYFDKRNNLYCQEEFATEEFATEEFATEEFATGMSMREQVFDSKGNT
jgi:hypothetical protein